MKKNVKSTTHADMGNTLKTIATEIYQIDGNYKIWYKGKIIMILSQNKIVFYYRKRNKPNQRTTKLTRLILARVHSLTNNYDNSCLVYIIEYGNQNKNLWIKYINHRDNGKISTGSYMNLLCPLTIDQFM